MIVFLLLVIVAILLFGASGVLGAIGKTLSFVASVLALFFGLYAIASTMNLTVDDILVPVMLGGLALLGVVYAIVWWLVERQKAAALKKMQERRRDLGLK